jgi:cyclohexanone monooxygenase
MSTPELDTVIVGAGYAGLLMLHRLRGQGQRVRVYERGDDVGGTWYWNRYPGARCDTESLEYSYQFSDELFRDWKWSERFATQPELQAYARHVAERFDLLRDVRLGRAVRRARFDEGAGFWHVNDAHGGHVTARHLVLAAGCLSSTHWPAIEGLHDFAGPLLHTGQWPRDGADLRGRVVGVIGTGSSAVQVLPTLAPQVQRLVVFQRTANYVVPAHNGPIAPDYEAEVLADPQLFRARNATMVRGHGWRNRGRDASALSVPREEVERDLQRRWDTGGLNLLDGWNDLLTDHRANAIAADFVRAQIRRIVRDPQVAERLCPTHPIGCKRISVGDGYYETFNRPNVQLVDVRTAPIERVTPQGVVVAGQTHALDVLVCATGFDAMTGPILGIDITGREGRTLKDAWHAGPRNYLGLCVHGFPNLFLLTGPGSPSVLSNMHVSIEQHTRWVADCMAALQHAGHTRIEARPEAEADWVARVDRIAAGTIFPGCNSWYLGANIPGKPRMFMPFIGVPAYARLAEQVVQDGYAGFDRS